MGGKRSREAVPAATFAVDLAVEQTHAQWWSPDLEHKIEANQFSVAGGVAGAMSAWVADERNRMSGQELTLEGEEMLVDLVHAG